MLRTRSFLFLAGMVLPATAMLAGTALAGPVTLDEALALAAKDGRPVLVDFWRDG